MEDDSCLQFPPWAVRAGPRREIYFNPELVSAAVVTCGGLCPGLNDVVQSIVYTLNDYGVPEDNILGFTLFVIVTKDRFQEFDMDCEVSTKMIVVRLR